jgi:hypothetical protein
VKQMNEHELEVKQKFLEIRASMVQQIEKLQALPKDTPIPILPADLITMARLIIDLGDTVMGSKQ